MKHTVGEFKFLLEVFEAEEVVGEFGDPVVRINKIGECWCSRVPKQRILESGNYNLGDNQVVLDVLNFHVAVGNLLRFRDGKWYRAVEVIDEDMFYQRVIAEEIQNPQVVV